MDYENFKSSAGEGVAVLGGAAVGAMTASAGGNPECKAGDNSFYCNFVRGFNIFKMILFVVVILIVAFFIYKMMSNKKGSGSGKKISRK